MKIHRWLISCALAMSLCSCATAQTNSTSRLYRLPEFGIELRIPADARTGDYIPGWVPGGIYRESGTQPQQEIGWMPEYSRRLAAGVSYRTLTRVTLLTSSAQLDKEAAKRNGWTEKPSLEFHPLTESHLPDVVRAVERLYFRKSIPWEQTRIVKVGERDAVEMNGWFKLPDGSGPFLEMRAIPIAKGKTVLILTGYARLPQKELQAQRKAVADMLATIAYTEPLLN